MQGTKGKTGRKTILGKEGTKAGPPAGKAKDYVPTSEKRRKAAGIIADELDIDDAEVMANEAVAGDRPRVNFAEAASNDAGELDIDDAEVMANEAVAGDRPRVNFAEAASNDAGVRRVGIGVPVGPSPEGYCMQHVECVLDARQAATLRRIGDALVLEGARTKDGRNVAQPSSVIAWLLEEVGHKLLEI